MMFISLSKFVAIREAHSIVLRAVTVLSTLKAKLLNFCDGRSSLLKTTSLENGNRLEQNAGISLWKSISNPLFFSGGPCLLARLPLSYMPLCH